jgi:hypothetical protein
MLCLQPQAVVILKPLQYLLWYCSQGYCYHVKFPVRFYSRSFFVIPQVVAVYFLFSALYNYVKIFLHWLPGSP